MKERVSFDNLERYQKVATKPTTQYMGSHGIHLVKFVYERTWTIVAAQRYKRAGDRGSKVRLVFKDSFGSPMHV